MMPMLNNNATDEEIQRQRGGTIKVPRPLL